MKKTNTNTTKTTATVAEIVTNKIIEKLENGVIPWHKPWRTVEAVNYVTQKPYRGINRILLDGGEYLTFKQIQDCGGHLKKGSKSEIVTFYTEKTKTETNEETGEEEEKSYRVLRYYRVPPKADDPDGGEYHLQTYSKNTIDDKYIDALANATAETENAPEAKTSDAPKGGFKKAEFYTLILTTKPKPKSPF